VAARRQRPVTAAEMRLLVRDPLLLGLTAFGALVCVWFALGRGGPVWQTGLLWPAEVITDLVFNGVCWKIVARPELTGLQRRFWALAGCATGLFVIGDCTQAVLTARSPVPANLDGGAVQSLCVVVGLTVMVVSMLLYPNPHSAPGQRLRFLLDAGSVLVAAGTLAWYFSMGDSAQDARKVLTTAAAAAIVLVVAFAIVRMAMSGIAPMSRLAAAPMVLGACLAALPAAVFPVQPGVAATGSALIVRFVPSVLVAMGPRIQDVQARFDPTVGRHTLRPYRLLPYGSVGVTFAVLLLILPAGLGPRIWGVVVGAVALTCVVVARQLLVFRDNERLIRALDEQATRDGLTGLLNRTAFVSEVDTALGEPERRRWMHLILVDLDDFKGVNDTLGHAAGDELLTATAARLTAVTRPGDVVARLGGDEFALLVHVDPGPDGSADGAGAVLATRLLTDVAQPVVVAGHPVTVRASVGVAAAGAGDTLADVMRNADIAMYAAKESGKSDYRVYAPSMSARILQDAMLTAQMNDSIGTDRFHLHYQPIVRIADGTIVGVEALVRWLHPQQGPIPPDVFIPVAERSGLIVHLGRWVLREACAQVARWRLDFPAARTLVLNVNVAGRQLQQAGFADEVAAVLAEMSLPAGQLTIEVTETAALQDGRTETTLADLRRLGVGLALDDFGTAASSLGLLLTTPVSTLKLDRSFVGEVTTAARQAAVATAVIQISRALDLTAVAEGVETVEQADALARMGYTYAQGFLFSRPLPADALARIWAQAPTAVLHRAS
jgi:diguanylate cyclase (GGDEF)-like protein